MAYSHGESVVFVQTERCCNSAKVFSFIIEEKRIVLHGDVKFSEKFVNGSAGKYVLDLRDGVDFLFNSFVETTKVGYPTDCVVFLGDDKGTTYPRRATSRGKNTDFDELIKFGFELW